MEFPEHAGVPKRYDPHDGLPYVVNTVDWVLKLVMGPLLASPDDVYLGDGANR